ncbi:hypothetical protein KUTeg_022264 [Tegillarca granosa]|uniref:Orc1-like AAA ATPase domain-containing protein n=1 Tax=Tegillarca granosa TaxID=220873 RepID=A0ABQ9EB58_TEGGR|nr:hypothetical protein KUTeg_022264 [Tegillarca granosa]
MDDKDLQWCVEQDFPAGTELTPLEREREAHQAFADARCRVYIGRQEYFVSIDENLKKGSNQPFVLLGESGSGKSALVANWAKQVRERQPNWFVFVHFIGSSAESASYIKLLRRLYEEIKDFFGFDLSIPSSDANLVTDLSKWLHLAAARNKCVIVFDALNQLDDGTGTEDLPSSVFLLLSTLPGKAMDAINSFEWPSMRVKPLDPSQKMEIITGYLEGLYSKTLSKEQKEMIVEVPQTDNPLYLKSLLDEVRVYGSFSKLTRKIEEYLTASNPGDLFAKILDRLETDFENEEEFEKALVRETTTAIWCSHRGMAESEIVDLLEVPSAIWSPFYLSIVENLVNRNGILNFFHDHLRQAVETKYLSTPEAKRKAYLNLANFFEKRELDERVVDELPFLLARAGDLERLRKTISNLDVFKIMVKSEDGMFELIKSWKLLGDFTQVEETYLAKLSEIPESQKHSEKFSDLLNDLGTFFVHIGLYGAARNVYEKLIQDLESRYAVSHGTVVYHPWNYSWKYCSQHPDVINTGTIATGTIATGQY